MINPFCDLIFHTIEYIYYVFKIFSLILRVFRYFSVIIIILASQITIFGMTEEETYPTCGEHVYIFLQFEADVCNLHQWKVRLAALTKNCERRIRVFGTYHRWRCGGGGGRTRFELCVKIGARSCFPDHFYIGFHDDNDPTVQRRVVDMFGNPDNTWWVFRDGAWVTDNSLDTRESEA